MLNGLKSERTQIATGEATWSYEETRKAARKILEDCRPGLVIAATDRMAMAVIREARQLNLSIPDDLSIMGFGGYEFGELMQPPLATVRFENEEAGTRLTV
ncbi:substrate-binding domain-containing protein [uncultured Faecalibaculum sp.]|uniref:substrate-binding domain-containing protein n=1 Tax=uncultured Faecalibaculum sp. TaxID=1729681 RepID=UPI002603F6EB|nr:substrate-binding domain-containing protein [uncultured Faecalibaculum sp.]